MAVLYQISRDLLWRYSTTSHETYCGSTKPGLGRPSLAVLNRISRDLLWRYYTTSHETYSSRTIPKPHDWDRMYKSETQWCCHIYVDSRAAPEIASSSLHRFCLDSQKVLYILPEKEGASSGYDLLFACADSALVRCASTR